jgi:hypothetical protein
MFFLLIKAASMENIKGSFIRSLDKSHPSGEMFVIRIDQITKDTYKLVFNKLLSQLSTAVQNEQTFCQDFFNYNRSSATPARAEELNGRSPAQQGQGDRLERINSSVSLQSSGSNGKTSIASQDNSKNDL